MVYKYRPAKMTLRLTAALLFLCVLLSFVCAAAEPDYITHTVVSGDTLGKIAKLYGVTVNEIAELNNITDVNAISVGDELKIPVIAPETTAAEETAALETATETAAPEPPAELIYDTSYITMFEDMSTVISVNFNQTDIRDVLSAFAVNLGCNFIFKGTAMSVTLVLNDVIVGEALDYVMKLINMTYITDGRTIIVGEKQDLIETFSEALQITEFSLSYVPASTIMSQIAALEIAVITSLSGENEYRFIAQGLPIDLSKVRDLISMIDREENSKLGPITVTSFFNKIELKYITAVDLQSVLASTSLPTGIVLPAKPRTLYVYASAEDYKLIMNICKVVDTSNPEVAVVDPEQTVIKQINLRYVTLELIESQITANSEVSIIKIATNKASFWLNGKLAQIKKAEEIVRMLDIEKNAAATNQEIKDQFRPVTLKFITAEQFNTILTGLSLPNGLISPDNAKTMYMYASTDEFKTIAEIQAVVDKAANNSGTASIFRAVTLRYITAEQFNTTLTGLSLPVGITFPNNEKTLFIFATPEQFDAINDMQKVVDVPANAADIETQFITVVLRYITAEQFNTTLAALNLPTGIIYSDNENTLYINATFEEEDNINKIKAVVDVPQNNLTAGDKFRYMTLRYMTADQFNETLKSMSLPTGLTFPNNLYTLYINSTASEYNSINDIRLMVDAPQNTLSSGAEFHPITLRYITAKQFNIVLASVKLPTGTYFKDSDKTMFVYATMNELMSINNIKNVVDTLEGAASTSSEFRSVTLRFITAEQFNSTLKSLSLPTGIIYPDNKYTLYIYATPDEFTSINKIQVLVDTADNVSNNSATEFRTITLRFITAEQFNTTLGSLSLTQGIIFPDNKYTLYLYATPTEFASINEIKAVVDTAENASGTAAKEFRPVTLTYITAEQFNTTLNSLSLPTGIIYPDNKKTLYIFASPAEFNSINEIKAVVDTAQNASSDTAKEFVAYPLTYITAEEFNSILESMSLPTGIIIKGNLYTLYINASPEEIISIDDVKSVVDKSLNASTSDEPEVLIKVDLISVNKEFAIPFIKALGLKITVIDIKNMQKIIWLQGPESEVLKAQTSISDIDKPGSNVIYSFRTFTLYYISAEEMSQKLATLNFTDIIIHTDTMSGLSSEILVSFPNDMLSTINEIITSLDQPTDRVTLMIDSADGVGGDTKLNNRISIISLMSGIPTSEGKFVVSPNISKTNVPKYILYLYDATLAEIKLAREIVKDLESGSGGLSVETTAAETTAAP